MSDFESLFSENISNVRFVAWDTETTGSSPSADHLVEIAGIAFDEEFEHRRFETLVKPPVSIPPEVIKIHGIDDSMVVDAPETGEALGRFADFLKLAGSPRILMAHNAGFDVGMVHGAAKRLAAAHQSADAIASFDREIVLDTCMAAKVLLPDLPHHGVEALMKHFKIEPVRYHRAMEDVRALYAIFMKLLGLAADQCAATQSFTLGRLIDLCGGYFVLDPKDAKIRRKPFFLPPRISAIESLCGTDARVAIVYVDRPGPHDSDSGDYRYITPLSVKMRAFRVYVEAFCHRDNIKKTFRADRIVKIGKVETT